MGAEGTGRDKESKKIRIYCMKNVFNSEEEIQWLDYVNTAA